MEYAYQTISVIAINQQLWLPILYLLLLVFILAFWKIARRYLADSRHFNQVILWVRLPKEKPGDREKEFTVQNLREEIAKGEAIFASIGGLRAQRGIKAWLGGRNDHFSFEIVSFKKKIAFYVVAPIEMARYLEQQINAQYPDAVIEEIDRKSVV